MNEAPRVESFSPSVLEISRTLVLRLLGMGHVDRPIRKSVEELIDEERRKATELVDARAVIRSSSGGIVGSSFIAPTSPCTAAVCTIGPALETRIASLLQRTERTRAVIADAVASALAEALADICDQLICRMARANGLRPDRRISPGYGDWSIDEQPILFDFLDPSVIGVTLTDRFMMIPRKSISFLVPLDGANADSTVNERRCHRCALEGCPYRVEDDRKKESTQS